MEVSLLLSVLAATSAAAFYLGRFSRRTAARRETSARGSSLRDLIDQMPGLAYRCRLDRSVELASAGCAALTGYGQEELEVGGIRIEDLVHPLDQPRVAGELAEAIREARPFQLTYRLMTPEGVTRWASETGRVVLGEEGEPVALEGFITDVTESKETEERLLHNALHDRLTGLANRALLMERLKAALSRCQRRPRLSFALIGLDLDRFKTINDSLGHEAGDQVLRITARRLEACLRQEDTVARLGGDAFAVLLDDITDASDAVRVALRIGELLALPIYLGHEEVITTASIGIASGLSGYEHPEEPLRDAEIAMNWAKARGGGGHELFDRAMHQRAVAQLRLETDLRHALKRQELRLHYQPIVGLDDGRIRGFEALLRWEHPERGLLAPAEFLSTAMETGLIVPITWRVLAEACSQLLEWQGLFPSDPPLYVSVNLTSKQFARSDLVERVQTILSASGLDPRSLHLEITENAVMDHLDAVSVTLDGLRELGTRLALDDFGTGYSSLASIRRLPIGTLKIDRSFTSGIEGQSVGLEIVRTIIGLAHNLGLEVVAEGVETLAQLELLSELRCDLAQGFHFARPMTPEAAEELLSAQQEDRLRLLA